MRFFKKYSFQTNTTNEDEQISSVLEKNIDKVHRYMSNTEDLMEKEMIFNNKRCTILYIDSIVKGELLQSFVIDPILEVKEGLIETVVRATEIKLSSKVSEIGSSLLNGFCIILLENIDLAYMAPVGDNVGSSIQEPVNERSIKSSHDGFVDSFNTNLHLLRKRVKSPFLKVKYFTVGKLTNTKVGMVYLDNLVNKELVKEVERRISFIEIDQLYSTGDLEGLIEDHPFSPFPHILATERPDRAVSYLTEGKINLIVDGCPRVLVVPITFFAFYQSPDDYNSRWLVGSFFRLIRVFSFITAVYRPYTLLLCRFILRYFQLEFFIPSEFH
jgi:spore germination protein KA